MKVCERLRFRILYVTTLLVLLSSQACRDEVELPASVQFSENKMQVIEGSAITITLTFDIPTLNQGSLRITTESNALYGQHYTTDPVSTSGFLVVAFSKGVSTVTFKVLTVNNSLFENTKFIIFTLSGVKGVEIGERSGLTLTIADDESPSDINFAASSGSVAEDDPNGIVVEIPLSMPAKGTGNITVSCQTSAIIGYGTNYVTTPAVKNNTLTVTVEEGATSASFIVKPVVDNVYIAQSLISFSIVSVTGVLRKGTQLSYQLEIKDSIEPSIVSFADASSIVARDNSAGIELKILLSRPALLASTIVVTVEPFGPTGAIYNTDFTTVPAPVGNSITLNVAQNATEVGFSVLPLINSACINRLMSCSISSVSGSMKKGKVLRHVLTIESKHQAVATFRESSGTIAENNASGIVVHLDLDQPSKENDLVGVVDVDAGYYYYYLPTHYKTIPDLVLQGYAIPYTPVAFSSGASATQFTIVPIDNSTKNANREMVFMLQSYSSSGCIRAAENTKFILTITDND